MKSQLTGTELSIIQEWRTMSIRKDELDQLNYNQLGN